MSEKFTIPDRRSPRPDDYERRDRRGQMKRSWARGVRRQRDGQQAVSFADGLTWGSIGQLLGYLLGEADDGFKNDIYERMVEQYAFTDRGARVRPAIGLETRLNAATWNLRYSGKEHSWRRFHYLNDVEWDVVMLQEVSQKAWRVFKEAGLAEGGYYSLDGFGVEPSGKRPHGAAILVRNGFKLSNPRLISGLPKDERALTAELVGLSGPVTIIGWHAPNAAGEGRKVKMQAYEAINDFLNQLETPVILGFDSNHWNRRTALELPEASSKADKYHIENRFFSKGAKHRLRDAFIDYLSQDELAYRRALHARPDGPLAVSYVRGSTKNPVEDRFDYIFASPEFDVLDCYYDFEGASMARSDHGLVAAELVLSEKASGAQTS